MKIAKSILDTIGKTPLVALDRVATGLPGRVLAKIEYCNPGASIKDRAALAMIEAAEKQGLLKKGGTIVELTSGNMGTGLAVVCAVKGYRMIAVMSEGNTEERVHMLRAMGAKVVLVPQVGSKRPGQVSREDLEAVEAETTRLTTALKAFRPNQFSNDSCAHAHELTTGKEIWEQTEGKVGVFVASIGTGGTFVGVARALKKRNPQVRCYAAEPASAPFIAGKKVTNTSHKIQGTGYSLIPPLWDKGLCDGFVTATDAEAVRFSRLLSRKEGIFAGFSSGANVACSVKLARKSEKGTLIVTVLPDTALKYLSTDLFRASIIA